MTELIYVPEEYLLDVITIIREGVKACSGQGIELTKQVEASLIKWCEEGEEYLSKAGSE